MKTYKQLISEIGTIIPRSKAGQSISRGKAFGVQINLQYVPARRPSPIDPDDMVIVWGNTKTNPPLNIFNLPDGRLERELPRMGFLTPKAKGKVWEPFVRKAVQLGFWRPVGKSLENGLLG